MSGARCGATYLLEFFGLARFFVDFGSRRIEAWPLAGSPDHTLAHLLLDQVLPRAICHEGRFVLHASSVALADGGAIAFAGISGRGKSTLASGFYRAGYCLLSDDCLLLEKRGDSVVAIPAYPSMRLWPDSAEALFETERHGGPRASAVAHYTSKKILTPATPPVAARPTPLRALYLLEPPGPLRIEQTGGMAAIMALVEAQFALDVVDRESVRRGFAAVQHVAGGVPVLRLTYPHDYQQLSGVIETILRDNSAPGAAGAGEG
jgi:hypothetical protein